MHWRQFDSKRKRNTLVMRYKSKDGTDRAYHDENGKPLVFIYSKG